MPLPSPHDNADPNGGTAAGRLFFGIAMPGETRIALERHLAGALHGHSLPGRPVAPARWHLTLRFLGDTSAAQHRQLRNEMRAVTLEAPFVTGFGACGAFPRASRAAVLWLGVEEGRERLQALAAVLEAVAIRTGFAPEPRAFTPHLTLSRIRPPRDVRSTLQAIPTFSAAFTVGEIVLFRSHLDRGPAEYEVADRFPLA